MGDIALLGRWLLLLELELVHMRRLRTSLGPRWLNSGDLSRWRSRDGATALRTVLLLLIEELRLLVL